MNDVESRIKNFEILYEDNHLIALDKPPNVPVQPDSSGDTDMLRIVKGYIAVKYDKPGEVYLGLVHRLDRPVGGSIVLARTSKAAARLTASMQAGEWTKDYLAVVCGELPDSGELSDYLTKNEIWNASSVCDEGDPGAKLARLSYQTLDRRDGLSLVRVRLHTGRHHQIRVQFSSRGFALWGDARYNPTSVPGQQIALWSHDLGVPHPVATDETGKKRRMNFVSLPDTRVMPWVVFKDFKLFENNVTTVEKIFTRNCLTLL